MSKLATLLIVATIFLSCVLHNVKPDYVTPLVRSILSAKTAKCWTLDRSDNREIVSVSATGTGFYAYVLAAEHGIISKKTAKQWIATGFDNMINANMDHFGWLYHFVDLKGNPAYSCEVSSIDSILFYLGAQRAAERLGDSELLAHIKKVSAGIDKEKMMEEGLFRHGIGLRSKWDRYNEGILLYKYYNSPLPETNIDYTLPLFVFYFPLAFYPEETIWLDHLDKSIKFQIKTTGRLGYSAMPSPYGYSVNSPYYFSPLGVLCCSKFFPNVIKYAGEDPLCQSQSIDKTWSSKDKILLDDGIALLILTQRSEAKL